MDKEEIIKFNHAVFIPLTDATYRVEKDVLGHVSEGAVISGQMMNAYLSLIPSSVRVYVGTLDTQKAVW